MKPCGAKRAPPHEVWGRPIGALVGNGETPPEYSLVEHVRRIPDQRGQSCYGHATAQAIRVRASVLGHEIDPSAMGIYALARGFEQPRVDGPLPDSGAYTHFVLQALARWGAVERTRWADDEDPTRRVSPDVLEASTPIGGVFQIDASGDRLQAEIQRSVSSGYPVVFAGDFPLSYQRHVGLAWEPNPIEPSGEGHAQCIFAYSPWGVGVANSWGAQWGSGGFAWLPWSWICSFACYDFSVITWSPRGLL